MSKWFATVAAASMAALALAGCTDDDRAPDTEMGLITPGVWRVSAEIDYMLVWVTNPGHDNVEGVFELHFANGNPPNRDWQIAVGGSATDPNVDNLLLPEGTAMPPGQDGRPYPHWIWHVIAIHVPAGIYAGEYDMKLTFGPYETIFTMIVEPSYGRVTGEGDEPIIRYVGTTDDGNVFDQNVAQFPVGSSGLIPGFSLGLLGLAEGETVDLRIPPALAYGLEPGPPNDLGGQWLNFEITIEDIPT